MAHLKILPGCRLAAELSVDDDDDHHHRYRYGSGSGLRTDLHPLVGLADKKKFLESREAAQRSFTESFTHCWRQSPFTSDPSPPPVLQQGAPPMLTSASTNHTCLPPAVCVPLLVATGTTKKTAHANVTRATPDLAGFTSADGSGRCCNGDDVIGGDDVRGR